MTRSVNPFVWVALGLTGCSFSANGTTDAPVKKDAVTTVDAAIDAPANCSATCRGNTLVCGPAETVCPLTCSATGGAHCTQYTPSNGATRADLDTIVDGSGDLVVAAALIINSDNGEIKAVAQNATLRTAGEGVSNGIRFRVISDSIAVLAFDDFSLMNGGSVRVIGGHALIILARNTITLMGEVDIDGGRAGDNSANGAGGGAGALGVSPATGCSAGLNGGDNNGFGGGAGGAFGLASGKGGSTIGGTASLRCAALLRDKLQGGSGGGRGGDLDAGGAGGGGGGAIQFSALVSIQVGGLLHANGSGGQAKQIDKRGGGGGGAGGGFLFEAPSVTIAANATVVANGGGGGDGKDDNSNPDGEPGQLDSSDAQGGGNGGNGGSVSSPANNGTGAANDGGGGGGASVGKIEVRAANPSPVNGSAVMSPPPAVSVLTGI